MIVGAPEEIEEALQEDGERLFGEPEEQGTGRSQSPRAIAMNHRQNALALRSLGSKIQVQASRPQTLLKANRGRRR